VPFGGPVDVPEEPPLAPEERRERQYRFFVETAVDPEEEEEGDLDVVLERMLRSPLTLEPVFGLLSHGARLIGPVDARTDRVADYGDGRALR
jgi:hypothetical protein